MKKSTIPMITGLAATAAIGTAAYMMSNHSQRHKARSSMKMLRRSTGKALKTVGGMMENVSYLMK
ncbi:MAG: hypothetical protein ACOX60_00425 [Massiliimalia sp.]